MLLNSVLAGFVTAVSAIFEGFFELWNAQKYCLYASATFAGRL